MMLGTTIVVGVTTATIISMPLAIVAMRAMTIVGIRGPHIEGHGGLLFCIIYNT
jgi:hypothetical protein